MGIHSICTHIHIGVQGLFERKPNKLLREMASGVRVRGQAVWSSVVISFMSFCTVGSIYLFVANVK